MDRTEELQIYVNSTGKSSFSSKEFHAQSSNSPFILEASNLVRVHHQLFILKFIVEIDIKIGRLRKNCKRY
jgi:hypothetical protein